MPYAPPGPPPGDNAPEPEQIRFEQRTQEREVRLTGQRILADHLRSGTNPQQPADTFWPRIDLDLTGATLIDLNLAQCHLRSARFDKALSAGDAWFGAAEFTSNASFSKARFTGDASFGAADFAGDIRFDETRFAGDVSFDAVEFSSNVWFDAAEFAGDVVFGTALFPGQAGPSTSLRGQVAWCWVRLDVTDNAAMNRSWPVGWTVTTSRPTPGAPDRPDGAQGNWGWLVPGTKH